MWPSVKIFLVGMMIFLMFLAAQSSKILPPGRVNKEFFKAKFINDVPVFLDKRVASKHGSWGKYFTLLEPESIKIVYSILAEKLQSSDQVTLVDIGANTGSFALLPVLSKQINVIAFEPNLEIADILRNNIHMNNIDANVTILPVGASNKQDFLTLHIPFGSTTGLATFGGKILRFNPKDSTSLLAPVVTLDEVIAHQNVKVDVIKIDTEGWEYYVLLGAIKTIKTQQPALFLEYDEKNMRQANVNPEQLNTLLDELAYACQSTTAGADIVCFPR